MPDEQPLHEAERLGPVPPVPESGARRLVGLAAIDLGPIRRHRDYRLLWIGLAVSFFGSEITYVAVPYQVYKLTGSTAVVGLLALVALVPLLLSAIVGGAFADAVARRRPTQNGRACAGSPRASGTLARGPSFSARTASTSWRCSSACRRRCTPPSPGSSGGRASSGCSTRRHPWARWRRPRRAAGRS